MARLVRILACALLLLPTVSAVAVQEVSGDIQGWEVVERCVGELPYPTIPQDQWTFEGVIFSINNDGIRAIRTDVDTSYFVALDSDYSFAFDGGFSPDGRWFVLPRGDTQYANMISDLVV